MLICPYFSHRDEAVWNTGRTLPNGQQEHPLDKFWAERFLEYPNDPPQWTNQEDLRPRKAYYRAGRHYSQR